MYTTFSELTRSTSSSPVAALITGYRARGPVAGRVVCTLRNVVLTADVKGKRKHNASATERIARRRRSGWRERKRARCRERKGRRKEKNDCGPKVRLGTGKRPDEPRLSGWPGERQGEGGQTSTIRSAPAIRPFNFANRKSWQISHRSPLQAANQHQRMPQSLGNDSLASRQGPQVKGE